MAKVYYVAEILTSREHGYRVTSHRPFCRSIVVTAVDPQNRAARQYVTVTRVAARPQPPPPTDAPRAPVPVGHHTAREQRPRLHVGMSATEVRDLLGEPVRVEHAPTFVFWHYGAEAYVVFEQGTGRVYGWVMEGWGVSP